MNALCGMEGDATAFSRECTVDDIAQQLHRLGFQEHGNETLYSGHTGRRLTHRIFIGPTFYQRLKHLVDDKIHSRARGPLTKLTRQPREGRAQVCECVSVCEMHMCCPACGCDCGVCNTVSEHFIYSKLHSCNTGLEKSVSQVITM